MIEALKQALERAERKLSAYVGVCTGDKELTDAVLPMVRQAIAELESQEPDDGYCKACDGDQCTAKAGCVAISNPPPQRTWVGLTKEQLATTDWSADFRAGALWAEAKLKEKNS